MNIVVDTNILISALIKDSTTRNLIIESKDTLLLPELELEEIKEHKKEILEKSRLSDTEFNILFSNLLKHFKIVKTDYIENFKDRAFKIIGEIDKDDVIFIATALYLNCPIWSDDKHFKKQKIVKVFTTQEFIKEFVK